MRNRTGHLWQNRYFSAPLDATHFLNAVRYVELNPVRAGITDRAEDYAWSSAAAHCELHDDPLISSKPGSGLFDGIQEWSRWLSDGLAGAVVDALRRHTARNLPCGSREFVETLEAIAGRPLRYRPQGRPPRPESGTALKAAPEKVNVPFRKR
jgi:putative transposase